MATIFQAGSVALQAGVQTVSASYVQSFDTTPDLVIPVVENLSADSPILQITATLITKTANGFSVYLSAAPNTGNYVLRWLVGSNSSTYSALTSSGKKTSQYPVQSNGLLDTDYFMMVHTASGVLQTVQVPLSALKLIFAGRAIGIPNSPNDPGVAGLIVISPKYIYTHDGVRWGQTARATSNWASE